MAVIIPRNLLIRAREAAEKIDIPLIENQIQCAMAACGWENATMMRLGKAEELLRDARRAHNDDEKQSCLWQCYDIISAAWRDSALNNDGAGPAEHTVAVAKAKAVVQQQRPALHLHLVKSDQ